MGTHPGGVHLEMTGQNVTECTGGTAEVTMEDLELRYLTRWGPAVHVQSSYNP
jgi:3-deoxy-7-phosphoheptulonate synthase